MQGLTLSSATHVRRGGDSIEEGAYLCGAHLTGAYLCDAHLEGAYLADLTGAKR